METCVDQKVPIIITSLRPPDEIIEAAHSYGGIVFPPLGFITPVTKNLKSNLLNKLSRTVLPIASPSGKSFFEISEPKTIRKALVSTSFWVIKSPINVSVDVTSIYSGVVPKTLASVL